MKIGLVPLSSKYSRTLIEPKMTVTKIPRITVYLELHFGQSFLRIQEVTRNMATPTAKKTKASRKKLTSHSSWNSCVVPVLAADSGQLVGRHGAGESGPAWHEMPWQG